MTISLTSNLDVYCYLKSRLEPDYQVVAEPGADYFAQWQFCYRILRDNIVIEELSGDLRNIPENSLVKEAHNIVERLAPRTSDDSTKPATDAELPFASRLPPRRDDVTWFSSGRSAFAWLVANIARPKRLYLPTLVCWSLVDVMQQAFPDIELHFYSVTMKLQCD